MINCINSAEELDYSSLCLIYESDIEKDRMKYYGHLDPIEGRFTAENDLYTYMQEHFFNNGGLIYALSRGNRYACIARIEPYQDGVLLNSIITAEQFRRMGYATTLSRAALQDSMRPVYSHVHRDNVASIALHEKLGFKKCMDFAILLDGSVRNDHFTYILAD